ncbi:hypothetical protein D3C80_2010160 [compost metagenome]
MEGGFPVIGATKQSGLKVVEVLAYKILFGRNQTFQAKGFGGPYPTSAILAPRALVGIQASPE